MARRTRLKAYQHAPKKQSRAYIQPHTAKAAVARRTSVRTPDNPFHSGLTEGRNSGSEKSRRACLGRAWNGVQHHYEVATDRRIRASERARVKKEDALAKEERILDCQVAAYIRRLENG